MDESRLARAITGLVGGQLAKELAADFVKIRRDYATKTLERASPGKFVETFVQCLQHIARGSFDQKPDVNAYLKDRVENEANLAEGLRICASRIARSLYTLRNKRNIAHKNEVDPNSYDLAFLHQGAAWIMAEMIRMASGITMEEAGALIDLVQAPVGTLVEEIDGTRLVHAKVSVRCEILILMHSHYPDRVVPAQLYSSMKERNEGSIRNKLGELRSKKLVHGEAKQGYKLTQTGYSAALMEIRALNLS